MTTMRRIIHAALSSLLLGVSLGVLAVGSAIAPATANHSHFRYGHYFWSPAGGTTIDFTLQNAFRRSGYGCLKPTSPTTVETVSCTGPDGRAGIGDVIEEDIGGTRFDTGDPNRRVIGGPTGGPLLYVVTSIDPSADSLFGLALDPNSLPVQDTTISHTYSAPGDYLAFTDSCCRFTHVNNSSGSYRVETKVNVGTGNSSPRSALPPVVQCPLNGLCRFIVPAADPDRDPLRFRLSTSQEAGDPFTQPGPPHAPNPATIDAATGEYRWDTTGASTARSGATLYSTQVTIEDLDPSGAGKSKVAIDFLIQLIEFVGAEPTFVRPPTPECGTTRTVRAGSTLAFTVEAADPDPGQTVTLNVAGLPAGATMTPALPSSGTRVSSSFSWTPTEAELGTHVITFTATDSTGRQVLCSLTVSVERGFSIEAGEGDEGSWIPVRADISNPSGRPVSVSWSAVPGPGVDPGATCRFSDSPPGSGQPSVLGQIASSFGDAFASPSSEADSPETYIRCTDDGVYLVTAEVREGDGPPQTATTEVTIRNVAPTALIDEPESGTRVPLGEAVDVTVLFTDPGTNDTHTCRIDWGDGSSSPGSVSEVAGSGICTATHNYRALGEYVITAYVADDDMPAGETASSAALGPAPALGLSVGSGNAPPTSAVPGSPLAGLVGDLSDVAQQLVPDVPLVSTVPSPINAAPVTEPLVAPDGSNLSFPLPTGLSSSIDDNPAATLPGQIEPG